MEEKKNNKLFYSFSRNNINILIFETIVKKNVYDDSFFN